VRSGSHQLTTRFLRRATGVAAVVAAVAGLFVASTLPGRRSAVPRPSWQPAVPIATGVFHVHTTHSDGTGTPDEIAAAAARAGRSFVVFSDHGNGTRTPDPPQYRSGVLCLDGVEITTTGGHYVAVAMPRAPYPLGGEPRDVIEDVARLGGFGTAAHPDSPGSALLWSEWTEPFDALEWLNADSAWRDEPLSRLGGGLLTYPFRPVETMGSILDRPANLLARWDVLTRRRQVVALAGADAHAHMGYRANDGDPYQNGWFLRMPSYQVSFLTFALRVELPRPFQGEPVGDARMLVAALRAGHVYTGIDALASPAVIEFSGRSGRFVVRQGDQLPIDGPIHLSVRVNAPPGATIELRRDGALVREATAPQLEFEAPAVKAVFRVEVTMPQVPGTPPVPWIVTNPIYVVPQSREAGLVPEPSPATEKRDLQAADWHVEHSATSASQMVSESTDPVRVTIQYALGRGAPAGQFAAVAVPATPDLARYDRLAFLGRADKSMRVSVQIRRPRGSQGERWQRSVYLDETPRLITVFFSEMTPTGPTETWKADLSQADSLLLVVDTVHTDPGATGTIWVESPRLERQAASARARR
jgi:hypothetical protein